MEVPISTESNLDAIDETSVDASIEAKAIGQKIRRLRLKRSIGLVELGQRTGLSASFLSQLETGRVVPTLRNLARIAMVFGKDLSFFFRDGKTIFRVSRAKTRIRLPHGDRKAPFLIAESLGSLIADRAFVPCLAEFRPGTNTPFDPRTFPGLEFVYVIEGAVALSTAAESHVLEAKDAAWIDSSAQRQYRCHGARFAKALIVTFPIQP